MLRTTGQFCFHYTRKQWPSYRALLYCVFILHKKWGTCCTAKWLYSLYPGSSYAPVCQYFSAFSKCINWQTSRQQAVLTKLPLLEQILDKIIKRLMGISVVQTTLIQICCNKILTLIIQSCNQRCN